MPRRRRRRGRFVWFGVVHTLVAAEELHGVHEAGMEGAGPAHAGRAHAALGGELGHEPGSQAEGLRAVEMMMVSAETHADAAAGGAVAAEGVGEHAV